MIVDRLNLFHRFLLILSFSTFIAVVALAATISYLLRQDVLEKEAMDAASLIRVLAGPYLSADSFLQATREKDGVLFAEVARRLTALPELFRVKIYDAVGTLVWSDERRLIGMNLPANQELVEALRGEVRVTMGRLKDEHVFERELYNERRLLEIYVPLHNPVSGEVYGVLEIYKYPVSHFALMDRTRRAVWAISLTVGVFLFASCSWLFWDALQRQRASDREKRVVEAQLIQAEKLAVVGEMLAGLAHEINNPLSIMMGKIRLILKDLQGANLKAELVQDLRVIDRNISRIGGIVRSLLTFARKSNFDSVPLDLNSVITDSLRLVEKPFATMNISFDKSLDPQLPRVLGDANQLQQVFLNLWSNARDAMQEGGTISIRTYVSNHEGSWAVAQVRDSGHGIPADILGRIFDPFFTTKGSREGAGLGLAVTYGIVKSHGGAIHVESQQGQGATFTVKFPARG